MNNDEFILELQRMIRLAAMPQDSIPIWRGSRGTGVSQVTMRSYQNIIAVELDNGDTFEITSRRVHESKA